MNKVFSCALTSNYNSGRKNEEAVGKRKNERVEMFTMAAGKPESPRPPKKFVCSGCN
jgi:hypothetical protein